MMDVKVLSKGKNKALGLEVTAFQNSEGQPSDSKYQSGNKKFPSLSGALQLIEGLGQPMPSSAPFVLIQQYPPAVLAYWKEQ